MRHPLEKLPEVLAEAIASEVPFLLVIRGVETEIASNMAIADLQKVIEEVAQEARKLDAAYATDDLKQTTLDPGPLPERMN